MKILGYKHAHELAAFVIEAQEMPRPSPKPQDLLVRIKAISTNPVDTKIRRSRSATGDRPVILGWDAAGVVEEIGLEVKGFAVGDEVYYAGALMRDGCYAEYQIVDHRVVAKKPKNLSFTEAAALPLTSLTAWEALLERGFVYTPQTTVLVIGGAGGVGSMAIQLLKAMTPARVIATASRPDTIAWCKKMGADVIINHRQNLVDELNKQGIASVDIILGTTHSAEYLELIPQLLRPFGHFVLIDDPKSLDIVSFKSKALSVHWQFMFGKTLHDYQVQTQGKILAKVAALVEQGKVKSTAHLVLQGLTAENIRQAHELHEKGSAIGKTVIVIK